MKKLYLILLTGLLFVLHAECAYSQSKNPKREFRAVWIATVVNIDWPSRKTLSSDQQKQEFIDILEVYKALNFNAVIVQVRAAGDAFYESSYEPWSKYLTSIEGKAPDPFYDPLTWMIEESHQRGFEFHAWFNPYRATFDLDTTSLAKNHAFNTHRDWMLKYGKRFYFNPGLPEVINYTTDVIMEVVNNYDIDAVHFDDYFYPYKIEGEPLKDSLAFRQYGGDITDMNDWRRANVDSLVRSISDSIRSVKPWVQFGISPFGVWRNGSLDPKGSDTQAGQTTYDDLYADPLKWVEEEWIDYLVPQLYWSLDHPLASHRKLVNWWSDQNIAAHLYIGYGTYKVKNNSDKAWNKYREIPNQLQFSRSKPDIKGGVFFSAKSLVNRHRRLSRMMIRKNYKYHALPLPSPYVEENKPATPKLIEARMEKEGTYFTLTQSEESIRYVVIYGSNAKQMLDVSEPKFILKTTGIIAGQELELHVDKKTIKKLRTIAFTYIDRNRKESEPLSLTVTKGKVISTKPN